MKFSESEKVYYPPHGAGTVERIEEIDFGSGEQACYAFYFPHMDMTIYLPVGDEDKAGVRPVSPKGLMLDALDALMKDGTEQPEPEVSGENWMKRHNAIAERIKTGDPFETAAVIKSMTLRGRARKLPHSDKQVLDQAKTALASEVMVLFGLTLPESLKVVEKKLRNQTTVLDGSRGEEEPDGK